MSPVHHAQPKLRRIRCFRLRHVHRVNPPLLSGAVSIVILEQRLQLAIDHAVRLCIVFLWEGSTEMVNVINGEPLGKLVPDKKKRGPERQARKSVFLLD